MFLSRGLFTPPDVIFKMLQIRFPLVLRPRPTGETYSAPPDSVFKGPTCTSKGEGRRRNGKGEEGWGRGRGSSHAFCFSNLGSSAKRLIVHAVTVELIVSAHILSRGWVFRGFPSGWGDCSRALGTWTRRSKTRLGPAACMAPALSSGCPSAICVELGLRRTFVCRLDSRLLLY